MCKGGGGYNYSCVLNAEITFPYNNHTMAVVATQDISEDQVCVCVCLGGGV